MRDAYFVVGEEVILQSKNYQEFNGDAVVVEVSYGIQWSAANGKDLDDGWMYQLDIGTPEPGCWHESALRKKHKPSEFSFEEIIRQEVTA